MRLQDVSAPYVVEAMREFDQIGRDTFLERYGFRRARRYLLLHDGKVYDSKAILGVAYEKQFGRPISAYDFNGGVGTTVPILEGLGFTIVLDEDSRVPRTAAASSPSERTRETPAPPPHIGEGPEADVVLISCVKTKLPHAAPARDLYTSGYFKKMRRYAEASGKPWFILSALHGLVAPEEELEPYECYLPKQSAEYQRDWGRRVVRQLSERLGSLEGVVIDLHAGAAYASSIRAALRGSGAEVIEPLQGLTQGQRLAWYNNHPQDRRSRKPAAQTPDPTLDKLVATLNDPTLAMDLHTWAIRRSDWNSPGLYSWWVDGAGAEALSRGLGMPVQPGLIYAGLAGATRTGGSASSNTLWGRINSMHLGPHQQFSTLRRSLSAILTAGRGRWSLDESALTTWMHEHLRVICVPVQDRDSLGALEQQVLTALDPPLNLRHVGPTPLRTTLRALRKRLI